MGRLMLRAGGRDGSKWGDSEGEMPDLSKTLTWTEKGLQKERQESLTLAL